MVQKTEQVFGPIDILVNNAGIISVDDIQNTTYADFQKVMEINVNGIFLGSKYVYPSMKKTEAGSIVNISSAAGIVATPNNVPYVTSKFAVRDMTKAVAAEYAKDNIRVNSVHPGFIKTSMSSDNQEAVEKHIESIPLNRLAEAEEITNLVLFLASDESSYSTVAEFVADGGVIQIA